MFGWSLVRTRRLRELEASSATAHAMRREITRLDAEIDRMRIVERDGQLAIGKAAQSKKHIHDLRFAIKGAIVSMRDLAQRSTQQVTPQHMADLAAEAEKLVQYTDLPR